MNPAQIIKQISIDGLALAVTPDGQSIAIRGPKVAIQKWQDMILSVKTDLIKYLSRSESANDDTHRVVVRFKLVEHYGNPPIQGGGILVGESYESIRNELRNRYGDRLISVKPEFLH